MYLPHSLLFVEKGHLSFLKDCTPEEDHKMDWQKHCGDNKNNSKERMSSVVNSDNVDG